MTDKIISLTAKLGIAQVGLEKARDFLAAMFVYPARRNAISEIERKVVELNSLLGAIRRDDTRDN